MKYAFLILFLTTSLSFLSAQTIKPDPKSKSKSLIQVVEASCGQCQFKMDGKSCDLAVRIKGKAYFVDGTNIDDHGDAHAKNGFCEKIRKAEVKGSILNNRFLATHFKLLPESSESKDRLH